MNEATRPAGRVVEIWRYPVAGLTGERLEHARLDATGLEGDRAVGLWDVAAGRFLNAEGCPSLRRGQARTDGDAVVVRLPEGDEVVIGAPGGEAALSVWLDREVQVRSDETGIAGLATARIRIVSLSSIAALARHHPTGQWDARRFRPHLLVVLPGVDFGEDDWVGSEVGIGGATLAVDEATAGCDVWGAAQVGLAADPGIVPTIASTHDGTLGVAGSVVRVGVIQLGDPADPVSR